MVVIGRSGGSGRPGDQVAVWQGDGARKPGSGSVSLILEQEYPREMVVACDV